MKLQDVSGNRLKEIMNFYKLLNGQYILASSDTLSPLAIKNGIQNSYMQFQNFDKELIHHQFHETYTQQIEVANPINH